MKKNLLTLICICLGVSISSQQTLFFDDFESYNNGDSVVNLSNFQGWGANGCGVAVNDPGNGAGNSDQYFFTTDGYMALQIIDSVIPGETYRFSMNGALTGWNQNGIKFQIVQLNAPGNADDVLLVDFTLGSVGGGQQNTFKLIDTAYTAQVTDTSNLAFKITKNWGPGYKIDNFKVECTTCPPPPVFYDVVLKVNTSNITVGTNGMYAGGGFLGGSNALQLNDSDGDGTWEGTTSITSGSGPNYYAFFNSPSGDSDWGTKEDLSGQPCGISANFNDRVLPNITSDTTLLHCFGSCETDGSCPSTTAIENSNIQEMNIQYVWANNVLSISSDIEMDELIISELGGRLISKHSNVKNFIELNTFNYSAGIYLISISSKKGQYTNKFMKR